jgi:hypothetical protein
VLLPLLLLLLLLPCNVCAINRLLIATVVLQLPPLKVQLIKLHNC